MRRKNIFALIVLFVMAAGQAFAGPAVIQENAGQHVQLQLVSRDNQVNPHKDVEVVIRFDIAPGWHILSSKPGEIGLPTKVEWTLPDGYVLVSEQWSRAKIFDNEIFQQEGYEEKAFYYAVIRPAETLLPQARLKAHFSWQACREECVPEEAVLSLSLPAGGYDTLPSPLWEKTFAEAAATFQQLSAPGPDSDYNLVWIMLMAFVGGLILNLMPCILPILSIKVISLLNHIDDKKRARADALFYFAGVVLSFIIMATVLVFLRLSGENLGWGFQLQSPGFVLCLLVVFVFILLLFLDVIKIKGQFAGKTAKVLQNSKRFNSFFTGIFSVVIASPCTAPFMGAAVAYALAGPLYVYYPIFLALGAGYALPFTLAGFYPQVLARILPKPGRWMAVLKKICAVPILFTCIWLVWILHNQLNQTQKPLVRSDIVWHEYDGAEIRRLSDAGEKIFIDFTAKWCLTCLANEKLALNDAGFAKLVKDKNIKLFKADWTKRSKEITDALASYGRNSIPLYVYFDGEHSVILPQLLTPETVRNYLK